MSSNPPVILPPAITIQRNERDVETCRRRVDDIEKSIQKLDQGLSRLQDNLEKGIGDENAVEGAIVMQESQKRNAEIELKIAQAEYDVKLKTLKDNKALLAVGEGPTPTSAAGVGPAAPAAGAGPALTPENIAKLAKQRDIIIINQRDVDSWKNKLDKEKGKIKAKTELITALENNLTSDIGNQTIRARINLAKKTKKSLEEALQIIQNAYDNAVKILNENTALLAAADPADPAAAGESGGGGGGAAEGRRRRRRSSLGGSGGGGGGSGGGGGGSGGRRRRKRANYKALGNDRAPPDPCITTLAFGSRIHGGAMQGRADQLAPRVVVGRADEQNHRWRLLASESAS